MTATNKAPAGWYIFEAMGRGELTTTYLADGYNLDSPPIALVLPAPFVTAADAGEAIRAIERYVGRLYIAHQEVRP